MSKTGTAYISEVTPDGIAVLTIDYAPVNALSEGLTNGVKTVMRQLEGREPGGPATKVTGIVVRGAGRAFCAGANIAAFGKKAANRPVQLGRPSSGPFGLGLEDNALGVPVVAAIHGFALGGGLELALTCHYRVISPTAFVGLPEVNIGLLPGGQGTQRLPRLIGASKALDVMLSGKHIHGPQAVALGIADALAPSDAELLGAAMDLCRAKRAEPRLRSIAALPPPAADADFDALRKRMARQRPGEIAPGAIIDCVVAACQGPWETGVRVERKLFVPLVSSAESAALRHMFAAERAGKKIQDLPRSVKPSKIATVGIIGAGLMGGGIAMCCANVGMQVVIVDIDQANLDRGLKLIDANYKRSRSMSADKKAKARSLIRPTTDYAHLAHCDLVVEAVFESLDIKKQIFAKLDAVCKPSAFICTNTSALDIDAIASACRPERRPQVMGTHFFSPANVMKLLENVRGKDTSDQTIASMMAWGAKIGKWCILAGNCQGFIGNRMVAFYSNAALAALAQGALPEEVDQAALAFGMRMGPFAMSDLVGLDLGIQAWKKAGTYDPERNPTHALIHGGRKGQKTNAGWYDYVDGDSRKAVPSPAVHDMLGRIFPDAPTRAAQSPLSQEQIQHMLFMPMINEGFKILEEGMAQRPSDIDVCYAYGYNFPKVKGGPMHFADAVGLPAVRATLQSLGIRPAQLLETCVANGTSLAQYWSKHGGAAWAAAKSQVHPSRQHRTAARL